MEHQPHYKHKSSNTTHQENLINFPEFLASLPTIDPDNFPLHLDTRQCEEKWRSLWEARGTYRYDADCPREQTFVIDTPPPTVSGHLHVGHIFSYTHTDIIARYKRMSGMNIFYPMGWDDNGLPTERRVQNFFNVWCDPQGKYDPLLLDSMKERQHRILECEKEKEAASNRQQAKGKSKAQAAERSQRQIISRRNFIELCGLVTEEDEKQFRNLFQSIGLSVDWTLMYSTINQHCQRVAQLSFLDLYEKGHIYSSSSPHMWDIDFRTAVAHADSEDRPQQAAYHSIAFGIEGQPQENYFTIATTRPELLPACIGIVAHPDDERYKHLFGRRAITPLFRAPVPIFASAKAAMDKGTGIVMVCTFGDQTDIQWWREQNLPLRQVIGRDGKLLSNIIFASEACGDKDAPEVNKIKQKKCAAWPSLDPDTANKYYSQLAGLSIISARAKILELLREPEGLPLSAMEPPISSSLLHVSAPFTHAVKFFEKGDRPLEFIPTRQWFVKLMDKKDELLAKNEELEWHPEWMKVRFSDWARNQNQDWCISRQRYFGVSIPVWYHCKPGSGKPDRSKPPILPSPQQLPVDPMIDCPPGFEESQRGQPGGFIGEADVFDTWFTSSMTPQINSHWNIDADKHAKLFPMDLRPQSHEIIRTWTFYTVAKALMHDGRLPWKQVTISGWVLDPQKDKMSKSKGNVITPAPLLALYGADAVRYWASNANLGSDTAFEEKIFSVGKRLVTKIYNAGKFVYAHDIIADLKELSTDASNDGGPISFWHNRFITRDIDRAFLRSLQLLIREATASFEKFDFASARRSIEAFFWHYFTDNYLEMTKRRAWRNEEGQEQESRTAKEGRISAILTLRLGLNILLRLLAPFALYITEEVWSWTHQDTSIHMRGGWPSEQELEGIRDGHESSQSTRTAALFAFDTTMAAMAAFRKAQDQERASLQPQKKKQEGEAKGEQKKKIKLAIQSASLRVSSEEEKHVLLAEGTLADIFSSFSFIGDLGSITIDVDSACSPEEIDVRCQFKHLVAG